MDEISGSRRLPVRVCEDRKINSLPVDDQTTAIEMAQFIVQNPDIKQIYGQYLLRLAVDKSINAAQSSAIVDCIANSSCNIF